MIDSCDNLEKHYPDCVYCSRTPKILAEENKKKYILNNPAGKRIWRVRVDGCLVSSQSQKKCDFMIMVCKEKNSNSSKDIYLVELKDRNLLDAAKQISETITFFKGRFPGKVFARVILAKVSSPGTVEVDPAIVKLKKALKEYGGNLKYSSRVYDRDTV